MNLTIKQKLYSLAGIVILAFIVFGLVYVYATGIRAEASAEKERGMNIHNAEAESRIALLQTRRQEKNFLAQKTDQSIELHADAMAELFGHLKYMQDQVISDEGDNTVRALIDISQKYEKSFQSMITMQIRIGLDEKSGLLGSLRQSVHDVEDSLKKFNNDKLTVKMLMMRRHEKDFVARGKKKYVGSMAERKAEFEVLLKKSNIPAAAQKQIRANMDSYHKDFNDLASAMLRMNTDFREIIQATEPAFERVDQLVQQLKTDTETQLSDVNKQVTVMLILTMVLGGGIILTTVFVLASGISRGLDKAIRVCKDVADGKLGKEVILRTKDEIGTLLSSLKNMDANILRVVTEVQSSVSNIGSASDQITQGNLRLSQRTEEQASSLEETASSMEEMTSTVKQNADSATYAKQLADENSERAGASAAVVSRTVSAMDDIDESSKKIADIIGTIDGIAFQTNLLALNAAVEAARAGEQGRGFAVVAAEVRSLAQRSADAAKEIKILIEDSVSKVKIGTELVAESGQTLEDIIENTKKVAGIIDTIAMASNEQASGIGQVNDAVTQMDSMTQENAALVEEAAAAGKAMQDQAYSLDELIGFFSIEGQNHNVENQQSREEPVVAQSAPQKTQQRSLPQASSEDHWQDF